METVNDNPKTALGKRLPREQRKFHKYYNSERKHCMTLTTEQLNKRLIKMVLEVYHAKFRKAAVLDEIAVRNGKEPKYKTRVLG